LLQYIVALVRVVDNTFNLRKSFKETNHTSPDFEFLEFDRLDFPEWQEENETNKHDYQVGKAKISLVTNSAEAREDRRPSARPGR
jgi:hypothetical protein